MNSKKCPKCGLFKELSEYYQRKKHRTGEYYEKCKDCMKSRGRNYYHQNHERQLSLAKLRKEKYREVRRLWLEKLKNKPCADCDGIFPAVVMDFDHREESDKIASISWMAFHDTSNFKKIEAEIAKCDLVCANCHRIRTHDRILKAKSAEVANVVKAPL